MKTTIIYKTYSEFILRENKDSNGVSGDFAEKNPDYEKQNENNKGCFDCSRCSGCSGCFDCSRCSGCSGCKGCFDCSRCSGCFDCKGCSGCSGCSRCSRCSGCSGCFGCSDCFDCSRCSDCFDLRDAAPVAGTNEQVLVPIIPNIHQKVYESAARPKALAMDTWHTCEKTHCRAGWVCTLAGEAGKKLEERFDPVIAAMKIYDASSTLPKVSPVRFFEDNETALADMKRMAELEEAQSQGISTEIS